MFRERIVVTLSYYELSAALKTTTRRSQRVRNLECTSSRLELGCHASVIARIDRLPLQVQFTSMRNTAAFIGLVTTTTTMVRATESLTTASTLSRTRWLVVDFDGTCTEKDTTPLLPKLTAIVCDDIEHQQQQRLARFEQLEREFVRLYAAARMKMCSQTMTLCDALDSLDDVSKRVTEQVSKSGVLLGLSSASPEDILSIIERDSDVRAHVTLRSGCAPVLAQAMGSSWQLGVLSINWCPSLIDATLLRCLPSTSTSSSGCCAQNDVPIWSNSVDQRGVVSQHVVGALDKKARIAKLKRSGFVVYIGDSTTDLAALVEADLGILIGHSKSTTSIAEEWGIEVVPLNQRQAMEKDESASVIWMAESWSEIELLLTDLTPCE
jgi:phosphoserine phosphatase